MFQIAAAGFTLGLGLILAIGAQNAFVLRQGLRRSHVFAVSLTCAASDAALIALGVAFFSQMAEALPWLTPVLRYAGAAFLVVFGALALRSAYRGESALELAGGPSEPLVPTLITCLLLTWANPHVYLDTVVLLGSYAAQYGPLAPIFGLGAMTASFVFFFSLGYGARALTPLFQHPRAGQVLDLIVAGIMWALALKLLIDG